MTLTGPSPAPSSTPTDALGNYTLSNLTLGGSYTVTPSKAALPPGSAGINTADVIAAQRHYLTLGTLPPGCRRDAGDVNGDGRIDTSDVVAIQRFFLGQPFGTANVGKYQFTPVSRSYPGIATDQTNQDYSRAGLRRRRCWVCAPSGGRPVTRCGRVSAVRFLLR